VYCLTLTDDMRFPVTLEYLHWNPVDSLDLPAGSSLSLMLSLPNLKEQMRWGKAVSPKRRLSG
jgi:hypothetical protein